jgi:hypothetical protein
MRSTRTGRIEGPFLPATASNVGMVQLTLFSPQSRAAARPLAAARGLGREEGVLVRFSVIGKAPDLAKKCPCSPYKKAPSRCVDASNEAWRLRSQLRVITRGGSPCDGTTATGAATVGTDPWLVCYKKHTAQRHSMERKLGGYTNISDYFRSRRIHARRNIARSWRLQRSKIGVYSGAARRATGRVRCLLAQTVMCTRIFPTLACG